METSGGCCITDLGLIPVKFWFIIFFWGFARIFAYSKAPAARADAVGGIIWPGTPIKITSAKVADCKLESKPERF